MKRVIGLALLVAAATFAVRLANQPAAPRVVRASDTAAGTTAVARGRQVYLRYGCSTCHGADGKGGFANANAETDSKVPAVNYVAEGFTKRELRKKILDGFAPVGKKDPNGPRPPFRMPGWAGQMTDADLTDLVEYLWSLYPTSETQKWR
ncbi:MAG TPA: cytochrome c [Vicinamibacterales bacterium]|nr:cytochrome c [Vicinamibacterales bacterium]